MNWLQKVLQILSFVCPLNGITQYSGYKLETYGTREGLLTSKIFVLSQSADRRLWIGTELGISVYNGYEFINHIYTSGNESVGRILAIVHDRSGGTWIGGDKGLYFLKGNQLEKIQIRARESLAIESLLIDQNSNLWIGELHSLYQVPATRLAGIKEKGDVLHISPYADFTKRVFALSEDNSGNIYASSYDGIFRISTNTPSYSVAWKNSNPVSYVRSVAVTSPDSIYWNSLDNHPNELIHGKWKPHVSPDFVGRLVFKKKGQVYALTTDGVASIGPNGLRTLVSFAGQTNNAVTALIDEEENIWIGSWEGLLKYRKINFKQYHLEELNHNEVFSMLETSDRDLLFGSNRGLVFMKKEEKLVRAAHIPKLFALAEVMCMTETSEGSLWFGSGYQGIAQYKNKRIRNFKSDSLLKDENCEELYLTRAGHLLAATENGISVIDPNQEFPLISHFPFLKTYSRYPELFGSFEKRKSGYFFYGSQGLYTMRDNYIVNDSIEGMPVHALYIHKMIRDAKGYIWIATMGKGLLQCIETANGRLKLVKQYDQRSGATSDNALSVISDKNDNIWWGDYMGVTVLINPGKAERMVTFNEKDGLLSTYYQTLKLEKQKDGTIWGLTSMGVFSFHPDNIWSNSLPPILTIDTVSGKDGTNYDKIPLSLSYNKNTISIFYTAVSLTDPSKIRYAYRLIGVDTGWSYTNNRMASFNSLPPGSYTFELKATNNNNVWTTNSTSYSFTIRPPFWQTWWFKAFAALMLISLIYFLVNRRIRRIKKEAAVSQQLSELEAKALRAQMNPHFIFNSLNAIQELVVTKNDTQAYLYLSRFSKLLRMVLNNSEKNFIPLHAELEMNRLYLELESLRFNQSFQYEIVVHEMIEEETTLVPSLLFQPFLENAIWHGLLNKEGQKKLSMRFNEENGKLICTIEDNGIGRSRSREIRSSRIGGSLFESKGMILTRQRLDTLNKQLKENMVVNIEDLLDNEGKAGGTRITIILP